MPTNYKLTVDERITDAIITQAEMQIGEIGMIVDTKPSELNNHWILKTYGERCVSLNDPRKTWSPGSASIKVRKIRDGETITLTGVAR